MTTLLYGLITGFLFGFLLQKARVVRYDKQLGALRLQDMTIIKFMGSSILVGMVGVYLLYDLGMAELSIKEMITGPVVIGGLVFGLGWGLLGYCPGTSAGALGEGRVDAFWGILGMIAGASLFAAAYPWLMRTVYTWGDFGEVTIPQILGINHWLIIPIVIFLVVLFFRWFEKKGL